MGQVLILELRIRALVTSLAVRVAASILDEPVALLDAGEWGVAFEALCDNLYEEQAPVFGGAVAEIEAIGAELESTRRSWRLVRELTIGFGTEE